jgi:hypothetical protein
MKVSSIITYMDIFGQGINLNINNNIKSKTIIGGILTIIMMIFLLFMFFIMAQDVLSHTNPQISLEQQINVHKTSNFKI